MNYGNKVKLVMNMIYHLNLIINLPPKITVDRKNKFRESEREKECERKKNRMQHSYECERMQINLHPSYLLSGSLKF